LGQPFSEASRLLTEHFWELGAHAELEPKPRSAVRDGDWKYVETPNDGEFLFKPC
jgi:hypothetical protein